ncbi:hypothetical protein [Microcoleus sp. bin38.metabat.b11b12b14.051]|uniref:hypothetical protein n=1 Tax=Microcoleus sp. bin38.metabat.b11b12b14.051 TaxID=2742709 RepID=UPI0025FC3D7D|nr:hypothetical protein [Microcoleus sp. bin38.metabat.b11b12b14.051]
MVLLNLSGQIPEPSIPPEIARDAETATAIANHEAKADPHPVYLTQAEGDGRYRQSTVALTDADIPALIARDAETAAAIANHEAKADPHPVYLTQAEGDGRYRQSTVALTDADIPALIARDAETAAAIANHEAKADPHPSLWTRITNAFLALTGGQAIIKNNPAMSAVSYSAGQNHLELRTTDSSNPAIGFHRAGFTGTALYHLGYGNDSLRIRNADGFDGALIHDGNIASKVITNRLDDLTIVKQKLITGITPLTQGEGAAPFHGISDPSKIIGAVLSVRPFPTVWMMPGAGIISPGYEIILYGWNADRVTIYTKAGNSALILGKPFQILVSYIN